MHLKAFGATDIRPKHFLCGSMDSLSTLQRFKTNLHFEIRREGLNTPSGLGAETKLPEELDPK